MDFQFNRASCYFLQQFDDESQMICDVTNTSVTLSYFFRKKTILVNISNLLMQIKNALHGTPSLAQHSVSSSKLCLTLLLVHTNKVLLFYPPLFCAPEISINLQAQSYS